jgi:hypothetical protein
VPPRVGAYLVLVLVLGLAGILLFGALHALLIVPIWRRLVGGIPFALLAAAAIAWVYLDLRDSGRLAPGLRDGCLYGALLWLSVLPTTLLGSILRITGFHRQSGNLELAAELITAALTGAAVGRLWGRTHRLALAWACLVTGLVLAMAGPIPVVNGRRPLFLFLGFLPLYVVAGLTLAILARWLRLPRRIPL